MMYRLRPAPVALAVLAVAVATVSAGLVVCRIFSGPLLPTLLVAATVGAVAITGLLRAMRVGAVTAVVGGLAGLAACLVGVAAALRNPADGSLAAVLLDAVRNSGARILTSAIPVPVEPDTVLLPLAATWLAASIATVLLGPLRASSRTAAPNRRAGFAAVPPTLLLIGALVLVGPNGSPSYPALAAFVVALAGLLVVSGQAWSVLAGATADDESRRVTRTARLRRAAAAVTVVAVLAVASGLAGPALASLVKKQPVDPRSYVVPPSTQLDQLSPLGMLAAWAIDSKQDLLTVKTDHPERIQWVTLSGFDGISWAPDRTFRSAGSVLPAPAAVSDPTLTVRQTVTVTGLRGSWLPAVNRVTQVRGPRIGFDADAGSVLAVDGLSAGLTYQAVSAAPQPSPDSLVTAAIPSAASTEQYLTVPAGVDPGIVTLAQKTASAGSPYRKALLLERLLRTKYRFWSKAPSGNGYVTLKNFLLVPADKGGARGTSEQFASAFALLARIVGLPSRVVVGFHAGQRIGASTYRIRSGDAFAWPEVYFVGHGWVPFDPTPTAAKGATPPDENTPQAKSEQKQKSQQLDNSQPTPNPSAGTPTPSPSARPRPTGGGSGPALVGGFAGTSVLVLLIAAIPLARWRRTARRLDGGPPESRIRGAWSEVRDSLRQAGFRPDPSMSAAELADFATTLPTQPLPDLHPLATTVNAVAFAPPAVPAEAAAEATALSRTWSRALRSRLGPLKRLLWHLDPRRLFWHG